MDKPTSDELEDRVVKLEWFMGQLTLDLRDFAWRVTEQLASTGDLAEQWSAVSLAASPFDPVTLES